MDKLMRIGVDGEITDIELGYESVRDAIGGILDVVTVPRLCTMFVHDEGLLDGMELNWVASLLAFRVLYGPVVLCGPEPDAEGDSVPPSETATMVARRLSTMVRAVRADARDKGQNVTSFGNPDTLPPPQVHSFDTYEEMEAFLEGRGSDDG